MVFIFFGRENFKGSHFEYFVKKVVSGNAVKIVLNFLANLGVYREHLFFCTLFY